KKQPEKDRVSSITLRDRSGLVALRKTLQKNDITLVEANNVNDSIKIQLSDDYRKLLKILSGDNVPHHTNTVLEDEFLRVVLGTFRCDDCHPHVQTGNSHAHDLGHLMSESNPRNQIEVKAKIKSRIPITQLVGINRSNKHNAAKELIWNRVSDPKQNDAYNISAHCQKKIEKKIISNLS
ncbi:hypothetical protein JTB14_033293, partial [Gonioctena quinquepunctata]